MFAKVQKLFFILVILIQSTAFSQQKPGLAEQYNSWLAFTGLGKIILAPAQANINNKTLILKPAAAYTDPQKFARAWLSAKNNLKSNGVNIYALLLNKLADFSFSRPDMLTIRLVTADPEIFSLNITYSRGAVKPEENFGLERGATPAENIAVDLGYTKDICLATGKAISVKQILATLDGLFKKYKAGEGGIRIDSMVNERHSGVKYRVSNIDGVVTQTRLHEVILLNISLDPGGLCYNADILYSGGEKTPDPDYNAPFYHEAALKYRAACDVYERNLEQRLKQLFNGK